MSISLPYLEARGQKPRPPETLRLLPRKTSARHVHPSSLPSSRPDVLAGRRQGKWPRMAGTGHLGSSRRALRGILEPHVMFY